MQEKSDELYQIALECNEREAVPTMIDGEEKMRTPEGLCVEEWSAWNEAEEHVVDLERRRALKKGPKCPTGKVAYCDHWCARECNPAEKVWMCVNEYDAREGLMRNFPRY